MARTILSVEADFKNAAKAASDFTSGLEDSLSKALKQDKGFTSFARSIEKINKIETDYRRTKEKFDKNEALRQKHLNGELRSHILDLTKKQLQYASQIKRLEAPNRRLNVAQKERLDTLREQMVELKKELDTSRSIRNNYDGFLKTHKQLSRELQNEGDRLGKFSRNLSIAAESAKEIRDYFDDLADPSKIAERLEGAAERMGDAFKDGIDVQALSRDLGKGLGKGINVAFKAMSGAAGGGKLSTAIMAAGGAVAGLVAGLGILLAAFIAVDKKVKEFNKDIIKTHGALSVMRLGGGNLSEGLKIVKHSVMDLTRNFGVSEDEARSLFDTLDKGGITLDRLARNTGTAIQKTEDLQASLRSMHQVANLMGVGLSEYADNLTNYVNDLAMSADTVNDSFTAIADMAARAGFGTRRFYSMVVQATSGQASLNTRLEDTGDLLLRMSKIMGQKKAEEAVGGEGSRLAEQSAQERARSILVAGGRGRQVYAREAQVQSANFLKDLTKLKLRDAFDRALSGAGVQGPTGDAAALVRTLGKTTAEQQRSMLARLRSEGNDELARRLEQITQLNLGATGGLSAGVGGIGALGQGGSFAMQAAMMERFMDPTTGRLSVQHRAAAESVTGLSGSRMDAMLSMMSAQRGSLELMQKLIKEGKIAEAKRIAGDLGVQIRGTGRTAQITDETGHEIRNSLDLFQVTGQRSSEELAKLRDEATSIAYQTMDATVSVADILENKVAMYIQRVYEWLNGFLGPLLESLPGFSDQREAFEKKRKTVSAFEKEIENLQKQSEGERTRMARLSTTVTTATATPEDKRRAEEEIKRIQEAQTLRTQQIQGLRESVQRIREGNTYDTRVIVPEHLRSQAQGVETQLSPEVALERTRRRLGITAPSAPRAAPALPVGQGVLAPGTAPGPFYEAPAAGGGVLASGAASGAAPAARPPGTPAPAAAPTPAPATPAPAAAPPPARVVEATTAPVTAAVESHQEQAHAEAQRVRRETRQRDQRNQQNMEKLLQGKELGDGLAMSQLPMAIATADAKMRLLEGLTPEQLGKTEVVNRLLAGTATPGDLSSLGSTPGAGIARALQRNAAANDFIYRSSGGRGIVTPINRQDQVIGMMDGGPIANATARGGGGNVTINVNGGDERRVFEVVRRAIQQAGITPNRVPSGAT